MNALGTCPRGQSLMRTGHRQGAARAREWRGRPSAAEGGAVKKVKGGTECQGQEESQDERGRMANEVNCSSEVQREGHHQISQLNHHR